MKALATFELEGSIEGSDVMFVGGCFLFCLGGTKLYFLGKVPFCFLLASSPEVKVSNPKHKSQNPKCPRFPNM